jgi:hypothetical protein
MRLSFIGSFMIILAVVGVTPSFAAAHHYHHHKRTLIYGYCSCSFNGVNRECAVAVSCRSEGGRCLGSCVPPQSK